MSRRILAGLLLLASSSSAVALDAPGGAGWSALPGGFVAGGKGWIRVELDDRALALDLPPVWNDGDNEHVASPDGNLQMRLERRRDGVEETAAITVLLAAGESDCHFGVEAVIPELAGAASACLAPRRGGEVVFLRLHQDRPGAATGAVDERLGLALDWSGVSAGVAITSDPSRADRLVAAGRVPRGKETVVFSLRRAPWPVRGRISPPDRLAAAGFLSGAIVSGSSPLKAALRLAESPAALHGLCVEIGDGWQGRPGGRLFGKLDRSWLPLRGESGLDGPASIGLAAPWERMARAGAAPVLWLVPLGASDEEVYTAAPDAFVRNRSTGAAVPGGFLGRYAVDPTSPAGRDHVGALLSALRSEGVRAFRLGGLGEAHELYRREAARLARPHAAPLSVLADAIAALRAGAGEDALLLGDWGTPLELFPLLDGLRPGWARDASRADPLLPELGAARAGYHLHRAGRRLECAPIAAWADDPIEDDRRALDLTRVLFAALTGRGLVTDPGAPQAPWSGELLRRLSAALPIEPLDLFPRDFTPRVWDLKLPGGGDIAGVFNWETLASARVVVAARDLGLDQRAGDAIYWFDVLAERFVHFGRAALVVPLLPGRSRLLAVRPDPGHPVLAAVTGGSFLATAERVEKEAWSAERLELLLVLRFPPGAGAPGLKAHVACPPELGLLDAIAEGGTVEPALSGGRLTLAVASSGEPRVAVRVRFTRASASTSSPPAAAPCALEAAFNPAERRPVLAWRLDGGLDAWSRVEEFVVYRDGVEIERTTGSTFIDLDAPADRTFSYSVAALPAGTRGAPVSFEWPPRRAAYLDEWTVQTPGEDLKCLCRRRSAALGPLSVGGKQMARGLGTRAPSRVAYRIDRAYRRFTASVGVDDAARFQGSVRFAVVVDGKERWRSRVIRGGSAGPLAVDADVAGGLLLELLVEDGGDGVEGDLADWGEAQVLVE